MKKLDPSYWSSFWQNPTITSFGQVFPNNYDGAILEFWRRQICPGLDHVLDIACGNGALTWIANDLTGTPNGTTRVTGVDIAAIDPFRVLRRDQDAVPRVRFIGSTAAEQLPMADASVDLAISQYGIEYSELDRSIPEVGRVVHPTGRIAFILHDRDSVIVKGATQHLDDFKLVRDEIGLHDLCLDFDRLLRSDRNLKRLSGTATYAALESRMAEALYRVRLVARNHPATSPVVRYLQLLGQALDLKSSRDADRRLHLISEAVRGLRAHVERVEDLWHAALSPAARDRLVELASAQSFRVLEMNVLRYKDGDNFGTMFAASRE